MSWKMTSQKHQVYVPCLRGGGVEALRCLDILFFAPKVLHTLHGLNVYLLCLIEQVN